MEFSEVVRRRRMIRRYDPDRAVDPAVLDRILDNAQRGPSAGFSQGQAFLVLDTPEDVARFWESTGAATSGGDNAWLSGMRSAPVVVVPLSCKAAYLDRYAQPDKGWTDRDEARWPVPFWDIDTGMASLLILQTVVDEGLGACFFGIPPAEEGAFRAAFAIPDDHQPIGAITIGHRLADTGSKGSPSRRARVTGRVHRGRWQADGPDQG
ncbi:MAG: nitroreductase family protein [Nocardioides sp.]|uniref:nitroreductase family protein n=1 Tax=Nocardioides sp. TaxID=35761 RepID=UPI003F0CECA5